jgi:hypothetical protein
MNFVDRRATVCFFMFVIFAATPVLAQKAAVKTPSAEKVVGDYLKAVGGKKRLAAIRDAVYQWKTRRANESGAAQIRSKTPAAWRLDAQQHMSGENLPTQIGFDGNLTQTTATNGSSVWLRDGGKLQTLTDTEAHAVRLQGQLAATRLTDLKNQRIVARTIGIEKLAGKPVYAVEFSVRNGAQMRYYFGASDKLLYKIENPALKTNACLEDYRAVNGILEAHEMRQPCDGDVNGGLEQTVFELQSVERNSGLNISAFDPPRSLENFDLAAFFRELQQNQDEIDQKLSLYSYTETRTEREFDGKGAVKKETVRVYEVFPIAGSNRRVSKLIAENGAPLAPERAEKEANRAADEILDIEREVEKAAEKRAKSGDQSKTEKEEAEIRAGISTFLRVSDVVAPREEEFRGRRAIVFDFRPRAGYKPQNRAESVFSKLVGTAWIDPAEKRIIRMEMRFPEGFSAFGGFAKLKSGSAFVFEQTRIEDGVWLPKFSQINASVKAFFVAGFNFNQTSEYSNYRRADSEIKDYKVDAPKDAKENEKP